MTDATRTRARRKGIRFDGICIKCGLPVKGFEKHPYDYDRFAEFSRRPGYGLRSAVWHEACRELPNNPEVITVLLARQRKHDAIMAHGGFREGGKYPLIGRYCEISDSSISADSTEESTEYLEDTDMTATATTPATLSTEELFKKFVDMMKANGASEVVSAAPVAKTAKRDVSMNSAWWMKLEAAIEAGFTRMLIIGPPGTGKSTTADTDGLRVTCHEDAGPESMIGTFIQKDGNTIWIDGPSVRAMKEGKRIVKDEIDHISPDCASLLYALMDDKPGIMLPTGEFVSAAPGYKVICTSNGTPGDLPDAILDRIEGVIVASQPHENALELLAEDSMKALVKNYYRDKKESFAWRGEPTLRRMRNFSKLVTAGMKKDVAAQIVFGNAGSEILSTLTTVTAS